MDSKQSLPERGYFRLSFERLIVMDQVKKGREECLKVEEQRVQRHRSKSVWCISGTAST